MRLHGRPADEWPDWTYPADRKRLTALFQKLLKARADEYELLGKTDRFWLIDTRLRQIRSVMSEMNITVEEPVVAKEKNDGT
jgi:hypothetical protein